MRLIEANEGKVEYQSRIESDVALENVNITGKLTYSSIFVEAEKYI